MNEQFLQYLMNQYNQGIVPNQQYAPQQNFDPAYQQQLLDTFTPAPIEGVDSNLTAGQDTSFLKGMYSDANTGNMMFPNQQNQNNQNMYDVLGSLMSPVSTENAVFSLGQSLAFDGTNKTNQQKGANTLKGIGAAGKTLTSLFRTGFAGAGFQNRQDEAMQNYYQQQSQQNFAPLSSYQEGGQIPQEQYLTEAFIQERDGTVPNTEVEKGEFIQYPTGEVKEVAGETHENGGVKLNLEEGTKVISDHLKIGGATARQLKKEFDIDIKASHTYADAIDKFKKKIGLVKLDKQQEDLFKKLDKQSAVEDEQTLALNEQYLANEIQQTEQAKQPMQEKLAQFTDMIFQKQEDSKPKGEGTMLEDLLHKNGLTSEQGAQVMQMGGYTFEEGARPMDDATVRQVREQTGIDFTDEFAREYFRQAPLPTETSQNTVKQSRIINPQTDMIADITSGTNRYTPDGGVIVGDYKKLWINQKPEYYTGKAEPIEGQDFMYMDSKAYKEFQNTPNYQNYKAGYPQPSVAMFQAGGRVGNRFEDPATFIDQSAVGTGYYGDVLTQNPQDVLLENARLHPELYSQYFTGNNILPTDVQGFQSAVNSKYDAIKSDAKALYGEGSEKYKSIVAQIDQDKFLQDSSVRGVEGKFGNYSSTRPNFELQVLPKEELEKLAKEGINTASQLKAQKPELYKQYVGDKKLSSDFWLGALETPATETTAVVDNIPETSQSNLQGLSARTARGGYLNLVDQTLPPPSALQASRMPDSEYRNYEAIALGYDPQLQALYNNQTATIDQLQGLSPGQRAGAIAQISANTQGQANQVIGQVNAANQQEMAKISNANTDLFNRYSAVDEQEKERFEQKTFQAMAQTDRDLRQWLQYNNQLEAVNTQQQNQYNLYSNLFPNFTLSGNGQIVSTGQSPQFSTPRQITLPPNKKK